MFSFRKWFIEKGLCKLVKTPRRKVVNSKVRLESLEERVNPSPVVSTDLLDYAPGSTALITANNFKVGSEVVFQVSHMVSAGVDGVWGTPDDVLDTVKNSGPDHQPWAVTDGVWWMVNAGADNVAGTMDDVIAGDLDKCENGSILTSWFVNPDDSLGATFTLTATGLNPDGVVETAMTMFTDANPSTNLDQFANLDNAWINGNLGGAKAIYYEGESVPYRMRFNNLDTSASKNYTFTISYDTTKGGKHALDYLTSFNRTVSGANPLAGVASPPPSTPMTYPIPIDPNAVNQVGGVFSLYGGTISAVSSYTVSGSYAGDSTTTITITFHATAVNPVLAWGGHIASRADWGFGNSAAAISGSPFHMRSGGLDGGGGNQDLSLSSDAVVFPGSITIIKDAVPNDPQDFAFTTTGGLNPSSFSLDDDSDPTLSNKQSYLGITTFTTYSITEAATAGWILTGITSQVTSPNGGSVTSVGGTCTIVLKEGENVTLTFTNTKEPAPSISVVKSVDANEDGTFQKSESVLEGGVGDQKVDYKFVITNTSPLATDPVTITSLMDDKLGDLLPAFKAANGGSAVIAYGASVTFYVNDQMVPVANVGANYTNLVTVAGKDDENTPTNIATDTATVTYADVKPTIDITKKHTGTLNEGTGGQILVYTFQVTNTSAASTDPETITSLTDTILGDLLPAFKAANGGSAILAPGASVTFSFNYTAPMANAGVQLANIVTVTGNDDEGNQTTDFASDSETYKDVLPSISIVKSADPTSVNEGGVGNQVVTYTYLLTNTSPAGFFDPLSAINVSDTDGVPVYVSGDDGDNLLEKGEIWVYTLTVTMPVQDAFTIHTNTVTVTGKDDENNLATGMDTAEVAYTDYIPKSIKILKSHTGTIDEGTSGQTLVYTYTVFDDELVPTDPTKVTSLEDNIIGNILPYFIAANGGSDILQPGGSVTFTVNYTAPVANANVKITNIVVVVGQDNEGNITTASATDTAVYLDLQPAIDITKSHTGTIDEGTSGQILVYSFQVTNNSTASTDPVTVSSLSDTVLGDLLSAFTAANAGSAVLQPGTSVIFKVNYTAPVANAGVVIANTVTVIGQDDELNQVSDSASDREQYQDVKPAIDITKSHTGTIDEGASDQVLVYSFTVTNTSTASTDPVTVSSLSDSVLGDLMPAFMAANGGSAVISFDSSVTFTVNYTAPVANAGVVIANTVIVTGQDDEMNPVEDSASDEVTYDDVMPVIDIQKSHTGTINEGTSDQVLVYTFTVSNMSTASTDPVTVSSLSDSVLGDLLVAFKAANGGSAVIPFGGSVTFSVSYTAPVANAGVVIANTVIVTGQDDELNELSDSASDEVTYQDVKPAVTITKSHTGTIDEGTSGQILVYTFEVTNTSSATTDPLVILSLNDNVLGDLLPAFLAANHNDNFILFGNSVTFSVSYTAPVANAGVVIANTVTVIGQDDEQNPVEDSASDRVTYDDVKPMLDIQKSHTGTIDEGTSDQVLVYSFTVSNMSTATTDPVTVSSLSDSVLGDLLAAFKAANGGSAVIPFGGSVTFSVSYTAPVANAGVVIANTVTVIGQDDEQNPVEDSASDRVTYDDVKPMIDIQKSHTGTINEGTSDQVLVYTFTVSNMSTASTDPVTVSSLSDSVLGDLLSDFTAANGGSAVIPFGDSLTFSVNYTAPVANAGVVIANTVVVIGQDDELNEVSDSASDEVTYQDVKPTIDITKSHIGTIKEGTSDQILIYTFKVTNTSPASTDPVTVLSLNDTVLGDLLPAFLAASGGNAVLASGTSVIFAVEYSAPVANAGVVIANTVTVIGQDDELNPVEDSASDRVTYDDVKPMIDIQKSHTGTINEGTSGQVLVYSFTVSNMSTASTDPVTVSSLSDSVLGDLMPAFMAANGGSAVLPFGGSVTFSVNYIAPVANAGVVIANTVTVIGQDDELNPVEDSASDRVTYDDVKPMIDIQKSHTGTINEGTSGQVLVYSFTVSNMSTASTDPVTVSSLSDSVLGDLLSAFTAANGGSAVLPFGGSVTFSVNYIAPVANAGVVIANTVTVIGQDDEQNPVEDSASDRVTYDDVKPMIDIQKSHTGTINEGTSGQVLVYSFTVSNMSTASTDPVTVSSLSDSVLGDLMPAFMAANGGSAVLPFGGSVTFSVSYTAPVANAGVVIANTVIVTGQDDEFNDVTASASDRVTYDDVKPMIDIQKSHTGTINEGTSGQVLVYSFTVSNMSTASTDPVTVSSLSDSVLGDLMPAFTAANGGSAVLPFGGSVTFSVNYTAPVANAGVVIANTVTVIGQDDELNPVEDSASDRVTYDDIKPMIDIQKSHTGTINEGTSGQVLTYSFTVSNMSTASTDPVTVSSLSDSVLGDLLAAFKAANGGSAVIPFGGSVTFSVSYTAPVANAGVVIANTVVVIGQDDEQNPVEDSATDRETYKNLNPMITVTKTADKTEVTIGSIVTYTYYLTNTSIAGAFDPLSGITLVDTDGTPSYISGDSNGNNILEKGEVWKYQLAYTTTSLGIHNNVVTASGKDDEYITGVGYASAAINVSGQQENGKTLGYYSNKNGQKDLTGSTSGKNLLSSIYNSLFAPVTGLLAKDSVNSVLVDAYGNYKPLSFFSSYANVRNYLLGAKATNMAYMLSAQLLTSEFNVQLGRIFVSKSILASAVAMPIASQNSLSVNNGALNWMQVSYSGVANIQTILNAAIASLKASPNTLTSGPDRVYQEGLKCLLDAMNNNQSIFLP